LITFSIVVVAAAVAIFVVVVVIVLCQVLASNVLTIAIAIIVA